MFGGGFIYQALDVGRIIFSELVFVGIHPFAQSFGGVPPVGARVPFGLNPILLFGFELALIATSRSYGRIFLRPCSCGG